MTVLSDKWIKKMVKNHKMISPFVANKQEKEKFLLVYLHMVMTQESLTTLKFLQM